MIDWQIHHGNCLSGIRTLADGSVDVTITDPPYEAEAHTKGKRQGKTNGCGREERGKRYARVVDMEFDFVPITEELRNASAAEIARVTANHALVFCQVEAVDKWKNALEGGGLKYRRTIPWLKPDAQPSLHGRWVGQAFEAIVYANKPGASVPPVGGKARYYVATRERGEQRAHPTAKPLSLMLDMIRDWTRPGELVLDAFAGSGTTGVACRQLGRRFVGWELDANYHAIAVRRIAGESARIHEHQLDLLAGVTQ